MARNKKDQERPLHELLPQVTLKPMGGESDQQNQGNLLAAKQSPAFPVAGGVISHALTKRGDRIMLDYTQNATSVRFEVDGIWMNVDPYDRATGDAFLAVFKKIANLNVQDRRNRQEGRFGVVFQAGQYICTITAQGVKTGERVLIKIMPKKSKLETLEDLGMREKMREQFRELINQTEGFVIIAAPPGGGLTTTWRVALTAADRFVRDFVAIEDKRVPEDEIINVGPIHYDSAEGKSPADVLPSLLLKQPDVFVVPEMVNGKSVEMLCDQVNDNHKLVITRTVATDAAEALLRIAALKPPMAEYSKAVSMVLATRLVRKLCEACRQPFQPTPQMLQKLGIPAGRVGVLYREFQPPPPEQRVDQKGRPIEIEICKKCEGIGYRGRTAIFELMVVTDAIREVLLKQPSVDNIRRVAKAGGHRGLQEEGILLVAQGITSLQELQRALK
jgi:type II secretory ATPase GspE/PulE/Tfp pilus assembly ATPase PilB-like protein